MHPVGDVILYMPQRIPFNSGCGFNIADTTAELQSQIMDELEISAGRSANSMLFLKSIACDCNAKIHLFSNTQAKW